MQNKGLFQNQSFLGRTALNFLHEQGVGYPAETQSFPLTLTCHSDSFFLKMHIFHTEQLLQQRGLNF